MSCHHKQFFIKDNQISAISKLPGGFYALLLKFSCERKVFKLNNHFRLKRVTPLERAHETEKNDIFLASL